MRKIYLTLIISVLFSNFIRSQCAGNCTLYAQAPIPYSPGPTSGNSVVLGDDQLSGALPIGFTFTFFCNAYTNMYISSNGFVSFNGAAYNGCCGGGLLPTAGSNPDNLIASLWTDLYPPSGGSITYTTIGVAPNRVCLISYNSIQYYYATGSTTHQIKLFETTNNIEIHSTFASVDAHIKTQGILNSGGTIGQSTPGRNSVNFSIPTPDAYQFIMGGGAAATPPGPISGSISICPGSSYTYSVAPLPGAISYNWTLPAGWLGASATNTISATPGATGVLSVTATYTCGTSTTTTLNVTVNPTPTLAIAGGTTPICAGSAVTLAASGANTYSWSNGALTASISVAPMVNTSYTVIGTSAAGCTASAVRNITVNPSPSVTISGNTQICIGGTVNLTANGANTYSWSNGALTQSISVTPTANTTYSVIGTNTAGGCPGIASQVVTVNPLPNISITGGSSVCLGSTLVLTANGGNTYTWSTGAITNTIGVSPAANTSYTVIGTNAVTGCTNSSVQSVTVNPLPVVSISGASATCVGQAIVLTANGATTYSWNTGALTTSISVAPLNNTTYSVIGTSAAGCTASASYSVSVYPVPVVTIAGPNQVCIGGNVNLTANGATSYTWNTGAVSPNISASPTVNTTYSVVGLDAVTGCTASASKQVTVNPPPVVSIAGSNTLCAGSVLNLTANGANTYTWDNGANTNTIAPTPTANTSYTVFGTNTLTGCFNSAVISVTVNAVPSVTVTGPYAMCLTQTINLNAFGANTYTWNTGSTFSTIAVSPTANISYTVTGSSNLGCAGLPTVKNITVNPIPVVTINPPSTVICRGQQVLLTAGGVNTYSWNNGALTNTINVTPTITTSYTVQGTNTTTGCYNNAVVTIQVNLCTGISNVSNNDLRVSVYPNPNSGEFTVELNNGLNKMIEVYDVMGRSVANASGEEDKIDLNISGLSNGVYYLKVHSDNTIKVIKIVKQ